MSKSFLGRGISFPLRTDGSGGLAMSAYEENIRECIRIILGTALGERVYRPDFGCQMHDLIFEPNNAHTRNLIEFYAEVAVVKWEPRVREVQTRATLEPGEPNTVLLTIDYQVRATNSSFNLVYPFFLRREEDL